jgi:hypothetical protein
MKPRLRKHRGMWECGIVGQWLYWSLAATPREAYELWKRARQ